MLSQLPQTFTYLLVYAESVRPNRLSAQGSRAQASIVPSCTLYHVPSRSFAEPWGRGQSLDHQTGIQRRLFGTWLDSSLRQSQKRI